MATAPAGGAVPDPEAVVRLRRVAVSVLSGLLLAVAPAGTAGARAPEAAGARTRTTHLELRGADRARYGYATLTTRRAGDGRDVDALVTKAVGDPGCVFLRTDDGQGRTPAWRLPEGRAIGAQCGSAGSRTHMLTRTSCRRLVPGWSDEDGYPVVRRSVTL